MAPLTQSEAKRSRWQKGIINKGKAALSDRGLSLRGRGRRGGPRAPSSALQLPAPPPGRRAHRSGAQAGAALPGTSGLSLRPRRPGPAARAPSAPAASARRARLSRLGHPGPRSPRPRTSNTPLPLESFCTVGTIFFECNLPPNWREKLTRGPRRARRARGQGGSQGRTLVRGNGALCSPTRVVRWVSCKRCTVVLHIYVGDAKKLM